jgi:hypothetical protein
MAWDSIRAGGSAYQVQEKRAEEIGGVMTAAEEYKGIRPAYVVWTSIEDVSDDNKVLENFTGVRLDSYESRKFIRVTYKGHECWAKIKRRTGEEAYYLGDYELITEGWSFSAISKYAGKPLSNTDFSYLDAETQERLIKSLENK